MNLGSERFVGGLAAALFTAYLVALPPHLVHHLFDEDRGRPNCPHLVQSQQIPELLPDSPGLPPPLPAEAFDAPAPALSFPALPLAVVHPRAPPPSAPSV